ncbi:MAG: hypothetical protein OXG35_12040 [Acidobacteria bacterium]|nr:hypothetical protein [Acidobacteriota bacterium]
MSPDDTPRDLVAHVRATYADHLNGAGGQAEALAALYRCLGDDASRLAWLAPILASAPRLKLAHDIAAAVAAGHVRRGEPLPAPLAAWAADVLERRQPRPATGAASTSRRDALIRMAVRDLESRDVIPTANAMSDYESGCEIVAEAFRVTDHVARRAWAARPPKSGLPTAPEAVET